MPAVNELKDKNIFPNLKIREEKSVYGKRVLLFRLNQDIVS